MAVRENDIFVEKKNFEIKTEKKIYKFFFGDSSVGRRYEGGRLC